jgi:hypothetical protein
MSFGIKIGRVALVHSAAVNLETNLAFTDRGNPQKNLQ